jgi:hypothetical protein
MPIPTRSMVLSFPGLIAAGLAIAFLAQAPAVAQSDSERLTSQALEEDLAAWNAWMSNTHPDLTHSVELEVLSEGVAAVRGQLGVALTRREAWLELARLNPVLADAHVGLAVPDLLDGAQHGFPYPVRIREGSIMLPAGTLADRNLPGEMPILSINGEPSSLILAGLMGRMRGESERLRAHILELRFARFLSVWQGRAECYEVEVMTPQGEVLTLTFPASRASLPDVDPFDLEFSGQTAVLRVDSFARDHEGRAGEFFPEAFEQIASARSETLIIDLRANGGGAREVSDPLLEYLTAARHSPISAVKARITPENQARIPGSEVGQVVALPFALWSEPRSDLANRFTGEVFVLVGPGTYSQAIAFAATVQDFQIGRVAGVETEGRANQTAQVQQYTLPNTGFTVRAPLYIFTRASGDTSQDGVVPDLALDGESESHLEALLRVLNP